MRAFAFVTMFVVASAATAGDWPQWLGPKRDATSPETVTPGDPKVLWRQPVGEGHSSPVVAGGHVYLHYKELGKDDETLQAFDAASGKRQEGVTIHGIHFTS